MQALLYLAAATALGLTLAFAPRSPETLRLAKVYAVCGLYGFMGTMILGVAGRHVPVLFWTLSRPSKRELHRRSLPIGLRPLPLQALRASRLDAGRAAARDGAVARGRGMAAGSGLSCSWSRWSPARSTTCSRGGGAARALTLTPERPASLQVDF